MDEKTWFGRRIKSPPPMQRVRSPIPLLYPSIRIMVYVNIIISICAKVITPTFGYIERIMRKNNVWITLCQSFNGFFRVACLIWSRQSGGNAPGQKAINMTLWQMISTVNITEKAIHFSLAVLSFPCFCFPAIFVRIISAECRSG